MRDSESLLPTATPDSATDARSVLDALLERWQAWPSDRAYVTTRVPNAHRQQMLDMTIKSVRETVRGLPSGAPAHDVVDLAGPLLREFWPTQPGPIAGVAHEIAMLRVHATAAPAVSPAGN